MTWLEASRIKVAVLGVVLGVLTGGGTVWADFVVCNPRPVDEAINSPGAGHPDGCSFLHDGLKLYFTSGRDPSNSNSRELWVSERESPDAPWGEAVNLGPNINKPTGNEGNPAISPDDLELYFREYRYFDGYYNMRSTRASKDDPWGPAVEFSAFGDAGMDFTPDGLSVYFSSRQGGGYGDTDIWVATRATTDDEWGEAVNLGPNVNDSGGQIQPSISSDGLVLFFMDWKALSIFMCIRATTDDDWGPAIDAGPAVNGQAERVKYPEISPDGSTLYFTSAARSGYPALYWQVSIKPVVDFDEDGSVGMTDLLTMIGYWGTDEPLCDIGPMPWGDGIVDEDDLTVLMNHWGYEPTLIAHWKLDETDGIVACDSTSGCDGVLSGDPAWEPGGGQVDGALRCDGVDDCVGTPFVLDPGDGPFSVYTWVKGGAPGQVIVSQADGANWLLADPTDGNLTTSLSKPAGGRTAPVPLVSESSVVDGDWHRLGLVWDGVTRALYVDDVLVAEDSQPSIAGSTGGLYIGCGKDTAPDTFFSGLIDDVRIYKRAVEP